MTNSMVETRRVTLETGATTAVECWGEAGPAILCVHGLGVTRREFAPLGEALAATHRVFAYDQRGHGDSAGAAGPLTLDVLAADLRAVADSIGTVAAIVGHAWGGAIALAGGSRIARALVLVDPMIRVAPRSFAHDEAGWDLSERLARLKIPATLFPAGAMHRSALERFAEAVRAAA